MSNVVYYIGVKGDGHVKIGTTKNLQARLRSLATARADGNLLMVLATEPGTYELEQKRHAQFAESRAHGEWFKLTPALQQHIDELAARTSPAYSLGYDEGYQTALGDRGVITLITCEICGDDRATPSGHVDDEEHEPFCAACDMQGQIDAEMVDICHRLVRAYGYDKAIEIAGILPGGAYAGFLTRLKVRGL